jgi:D-arginine dehydrogenase
MTEDQEPFDFLIAGAGFAGAATAYCLAQRGAGRIVLLECEAVPGFHASGRSAAMIRQIVPGAAMAEMARRGAAFLRRLEGADAREAGFEPRGSLLLAEGKALEELRAQADDARAAGLEAENWSPAEGVRRVSALRGASFEEAVWCPSDGVADAGNLLAWYLRQAARRGARLVLNAQILGFERRGDGLIDVATSAGHFRARVVVNAAGAWANEIARLAGADELPLTPCRRHLFLAKGEWPGRSAWPFVWHVGRGLYFRPESDGLLLSACDEEPFPPCDAPADPSVLETLWKKISQGFPALEDTSIATFWAGLRTLTRDGRFVIGWDARQDFLFWVAGLGGHGVTTSHSVGELSARLLLGEEGGALAEAFDPKRFAAPEKRP